MFTVFHNSPFDTLSIRETDARELKELIEKAGEHLQRLAIDINDPAWETIEALEDVAMNIEEYTD